MQLRTRFAPSPTGLLHVGNAYSALICQQWAEEHHAELLLRIEDIDHTRCRAAYADGILADLSWLGLDWPMPLRYQSHHPDDYRLALRRLRDMGVIYPCFCTRQQVAQEIARMASAPHAADVPSTYPGLCRKLHADEQERRMQHEPYAWRLNVAKALDCIGQPLTWREESGQTHAVNISHDVIIGRKDIGFSYHLAVVVDDAIQAVTHIIRGRDLASSTGIHRLLQQLLGLPEPVYIHHALLLKPDGERLAKRNHACTLSGLRQMGVEAQQLRDFLLGMTMPVWPFEAEGTGAILCALGKTS